MQVEHLRELSDLERTYWWHVAKRELALSLLARCAPAPGRLVEGGVGAGRNLLAFREAGYDVTGFDVMPESIDLCRSLGLDDVHQHDLEAPWPVPAGSARAVVMLDVLEHVSDPVLVLSHVRDVLAADGAMILTVPAIPALYGDWDRALGHYRRYTARLLRAQAAEAGLRVRRLSHWNSFTLPAALVVRGLRKLSPRGGAAEFPRVAPFTNRLLLTMAAAERWVVQRCGAPCGLSLVGVLTK